MARKVYKETLEIPDGCQIEIDKRMIFVKGEKGEAKKEMFHPLVNLQIKDGNLVLETEKYNKTSKKIINTFRAHVKNMVKGVTEGHTYKLKICSGHFPMTVGVKDNTFEIKNFIGEKVPRTLKITDGTTVKVDGSEVIVESYNKEKAGQMAASIEQLTRRPGFDKRIFQDGIYITEKDGKVLK